MNYCIIINDLKAGGAQKATIDLIKGLDQIKIKTTLILLENIIKLEVPTSTKVLCIQNKGRLKGFFSKNILAKKLKKKWYAQNLETKFDLTISRLQYTNEIVHMAKIPDPFFIIDNALSEEIKKLKLENYLKGLRRELRYQKIYRNQNIIAVSQGTKNDLIKNFHGRKSLIRTICNPINIDQIKREANEKIKLEVNSKYIIHVARAIGQKRHDLMIDAFKLLNAKYKLVLLTDNPSEIYKLVLEKEMEAHCIVLPFRKNPYPLIKNAEALVLSSDFEGFGLVLVEAIICGTPVISTNCRYGPNEILTGKNRKYLVRQNNPDLLAKKISKFIINKPKKSIQIPLEQYSLNEIAKKYYNLAANQSALLIKTKNIGDSIILSASINALPEYIKNIDVICLPESEAIFRMHPRVSNIYVIPRGKTGITKIQSYFKLLSKIRNKNYQFIFQFSNDWRGALLARYFKNGFSIARKHFKRGRVWSNSFSALLNENLSIIPSAELDLELLNLAFGAIYENKAHYQLNAPLNKNIAILDFLKPNKKTIFFHTQSRWSFKELPNSTASQLINFFHNDNYQVILSGSEEDFDNNIKIYNNCLYKPFMVKNPSLSETAAVMNLSDYVVSIDSMTIHMASALKKPVIAIFGPTDDRVWGPYKTKFKVVALDESFDKKFKCRPCLNAGCANSKISECLTEMPAEYIFSKAIKFINSLNKVAKYS